MKDPSLAIIFVSNGPGELATWVRPIAEKLHNTIDLLPRSKTSSISLRLVLVPCPNGTGQEKSAALKWGQFEQITPAQDFWKLLLKPNCYGSWPKKGLVVFLGGDQFWSVLLSSRLGYRHLTYAEWIVRWPFWNDRIAAMSPKVKNQLPKKFRSRCKVVGDLMADLSEISKSIAPLPSGNWIALLPGSKKAKLCVGVPFLLEVADRLSKKLPECNFLLPVAPTTSINEIHHFMSTKNPIASKYQSTIFSIQTTQEKAQSLTLITGAGTEIKLFENEPMHGPVSQCSLALTTVGANTAELGALGVPMIVIVPTQHLAVMQAWDGLLGILARLPGLNWGLGLLLSAWRLRKNSYLAWPNIVAGKLVVPEKVGDISPEEISKEAFLWLTSPERLKGQKEDLQALRGKPGAIKEVVNEIINLLPSNVK